MKIESNRKQVEFKRIKEDIEREAEMEANMPEEEKVEFYEKRLEKITKFI